MSEVDPRKKVILNQVRTTFQLTEVPKGFYANPLLDDFLNTTQVNAIKLFVNQNSKTLEVLSIQNNGSKAQQNDGPSSVEVCVTKIRDEEISLDNIHNQLIFSTINVNPLFTLLNQLSNVYLPTLESAQWADKVDNNIKRLLDELKAGLDNNLSKGHNPGLEVTAIKESL